MSIGCADDTAGRIHRHHQGIAHRPALRQPKAGTEVLKLEINIKDLPLGPWVNLQMWTFAKFHQEKTSTNGGCSTSSTSM